tara:strand:- start:57 stop:428 length:372 start_codon:yes stop_codon:yes gene_type:complete
MRILNFLGLSILKGALGHWWHQRLTAICIIPLSLWFMASLVGHLRSDHETVVTWISSPFVSVMMVFLICGIFYHAKLGVQVVIEDYVHTRGSKLFLIIALNTGALTGALAGVLSIFYITFGIA